MYEVIYKIGSEIIKYLITDDEASEATKIWENNGNYLCKRLDALLPSRMILAAKPKFDVGKEVFVKIYSDKSIQRVYKTPDGEYFVQSKDVDGNTFLKKLLIDKRYLKTNTDLTTLEKEFITSLIPIDTYYKTKMNEKFGEMPD